MFNEKKKYFKRKLSSIEKQIWDFEFKREKTLMIREEIRQEYDNTQTKLNVVENQIKTLPEDRKKWTDEQKRLDDQKILLEKERDTLKDQMKGLDLEVNGSPKTNEFPEGYDGINKTIDALRELQGMIKSFIAKL